MATLQQVVDAVDTYIEEASGLGITCIKGYPDFTQPRLSLPVAAILYSGSSQGLEYARRVGASVTSVVITLVVYASNEVSLFALAQKLHEMRTSKPTLTVGTDTVRLIVGDDERTIAEPDDPKEYKHQISCPIVALYE